MIAVIDNGAGYSNHAIWFIEVDSGDEARLFLAAIIAVRYWEDAKILATTESITWWHGGALTVDAFLRSIAWELVDPEELPRFDALPLPWLERIDRATREAWTGAEHWPAYLARRRSAGT